MGRDVNIRAIQIRIIGFKKQICENSAKNLFIPSILDLKAFH